MINCIESDVDFNDSSDRHLFNDIYEKILADLQSAGNAGVFSPYTSINTNILFFEKGAKTEEVWFFEHPYPEGYKSYSRSKPLMIQEFDREKEWWGGADRKGRRVNEYAWKVSAQEIAARNYNLDCKNPHEVKINHGDPEELMEEYLDIVQQMQAAQEELKQELVKALQYGGS